MLEQLVAAQRWIYSSLSGDLAAFAATRDWLALATVMPVGIFFGVAHALTPGHGIVRVPAPQGLSAGRRGRLQCRSWVISDRAISRQRRVMSPVGLPAQPIDATQALNLSAGVSNCKVSRGRSLS